MVKWIIAAVLLLPVAEIATFALVALAIGLGWAFALTLATTIAGFLVLRRAGRRRLARFRTTVAESDASFEANTAGFLSVLAGILLLLPGFLTDLAGTLLLLRPFRRRCAAALRQAVMRFSRTGGRGSVINLAPGEWKQEPNSAAKHKPDRLNRTN